MRFCLLLPIFWACTLLPGYAQSGFNGSFQAEVDGVVCRFQTKTTGKTLRGSYTEGQLQLEVTGTFAGQQASGDLKETPAGSVVATFKAVLTDDNTLRLTFFMLGQERSHVFLRAGRPEQRPATVAGQSARDAQLTGSWSHQVITGDNSAGFQTVLYFELRADGAYAQYSKSVGGGGDWSYDSGRPALQQQGRWYSQDNIIYLQVAGQANYVAAATYRFYDGKLVTEDVNGRKIWDKG